MFGIFHSICAPCDVKAVWSFDALGIRQLTRLKAKSLGSLQHCLRFTEFEVKGVGGGNCHLSFSNRELNDVGGNSSMVSINSSFLLFPLAPTHTEEFIYLPVPADVFGSMRKSSSAMLFLMQMFC